MDLVCVRDLKKSYLRRHGLFARGARIRALDGASLSVRAGSILALVGESGSGKTTLARCVAHLERPDSGEIRMEDQSIANLRGESLSRLRRDVQLVFQDPASALNPRFSACEIVQEPMNVQKIGSRAERLRRSKEIMEQVGLSPSLYDNSPLELSGGQRQRLAIARALMLEPKLLILDEAFSALDLSIQAQLVNLLLDLRTARTLTCLFITHDLGLASYVADEIALMHMGRIVERLLPSELFSGAHHPQMQVLLNSVPKDLPQISRITQLVDPGQITPYF
ncbi:MAG TPA: dipeptide/oligopeptide/nickel ABC transporter ATP-binding protein [Acidobacteriota bacterium]|nr:dipeptide/oligopeptide/nickel ABC transporter ATP-binding protein [Acidobacteriota bacterium]